MHRGHARGVRLDLVKFLRAQPSQAFETVRGTALEQSLQARNLVLSYGHDHFSADLVRNRVLPAELDHLPDAAHRQPRLAGPGFIVEPGMKNPAVVAALMTARLRFLLEHGNARIGEALANAPCGGKANDAAPDDNDALTHDRPEQRCTTAGPVA